MKLINLVSFKFLMRKKKNKNFRIQVMHVKSPPSQWWAAELMVVESRVYMVLDLTIFNPNLYFRPLSKYNITGTMIKVKNVAKVKP